MLKKAASRAADALYEGKLEKAKLFRVVRGMQMGDMLPVQFNPSEYQISRSVNLSRKLSIGKDQDIDKMQAAAGNFATFSATLYFDTDTDLSGFDTGSLSSALKSVLLPKLGKKPTEVCQSIANMLKYNDEQHAPSRCASCGGGSTSWATWPAPPSATPCSRGTAPRCAPSAAHHRRRETSFAARMIRTFSSPNRTKERTLTEGDPLWLMAQQEYDDPAMWRTIAEANGILNPRKISGAMRLKVPSIK